MQNSYRYSSEFLANLAGFQAQLGNGGGNGRGNVRVDIHGGRGGNGGRAFRVYSATEVARYRAARLAHAQLAHASSDVGLHTLRIQLTHRA